jgi:DNA repair protein RecO (recombination protein O)
MNQLVTQAIILARTDYGEADRILTMLTPQYGKLRLVAKGVRRVKSKLAGGIELFSVSEITFIRGRGEIGTLVSARLIEHYRHIVEDLERTMTGYELMKQLHKITEDEAEADYFVVLRQLFEALDDQKISLEVVGFWFDAQLLRLGGRTPNLDTDTTGSALRADRAYQFDTAAMAFMLTENGPFGSGHIKLLRLVCSGITPRALQQIRGVDKLLLPCARLVRTLEW